MKRLRLNRSLQAAGLLVLAALAFCGTARAQVYSRGSFVLPYQARWQGGTLPAGKYCFTVQDILQGGMTLVFIRGPRDMRGKMIAAPTGTTDFSGKSSLIIVTVHGKRYVRSLRLHPMDTEFEYTVPKARRKDLREVAVETIPVHNTAG
jgi:hypothetical protein